MLPLGKRSFHQLANSGSDLTREKQESMDGKKKILSKHRHQLFLLLLGINGVTFVQ